MAMTVETHLPPERQAWRAMFALSLGFFVSLLDQSMVAVALPNLQRDLDAGVNQAMWVSASYLWANAGCFVWAWLSSGSVRWFVP